MNAGMLAAALAGCKNGRGWRARCPAHDDHTPSLDIAQGEGGKVLVVCRAGCPQDAVLDALRSRGLWTEARDGKEPKAAPAEWTPILPVPAGTPVPDFKALLRSAPAAFWDYQTSDGNLLGYVVRLDRTNGKSIVPVTWCRGPKGATAWRCKAFPVPRPLYGLAQLAERPTDPVVVVEGEKAVVAAASLLEDHIAVTWPGGTNAVGKADWRQLKDRGTVVWPDADPPGAKAAREVADQAMRAGATSVRIVALPAGLPQGWDLADDIPAGLDVAKLIADAPDARAAKLAGLTLVSAADLMQRQFREPRWAVPNLLPEGGAVLAGKPKSGKSWLALDWAVAVAAGSVAMGNLPCEPGDVLLIALEDTERRLQGRLRAVLQGDPAPTRLTIANRWRRADDGGLEDIRAWLALHPDARLVVIDTLALIRGKPDRDAGVYASDYAAAAALKAVADDHGVALLMLHHQRKEGTSDPIDSVSGTAGLTGALDTILVLKREAGDPYAMLYVRGRDVHEQEFALRFDNETGKWTRLGPAEDFRRSEERREIIRTLIEADEPLTPTQIAQAISKNSGAVRRLLGKMRSDSEVVRQADGKYAAPL